MSRRERVVGFLWRGRGISFASISRSGDVFLLPDELVVSCECCEGHELRRAVRTGPSAGCCCRGGRLWGIRTYLHGVGYLRAHVDGSEGSVSPWRGHGLGMLLARHGVPRSVRFARAPLHARDSSFRAAGRFSHSGSSRLGRLFEGCAPVSAIPHR